MKKLVLLLLRKYVDLTYVREHFLKIDTTIEPGDLICPVGNENFIFEAVTFLYDKDLKPLLIYRNPGETCLFTSPVYEFKRAPVVNNAGFPSIF